MKNFLSVGSVVMSTQGYDKNQIYVVKEINNKYAYVIDGNKRHFYKPKKKNLKHLLGFSIKCVLDLNNISKTNNEICKLVKSFKKAINKI